MIRPNEYVSFRNKICFIYICLNAKRFFNVLLHQICEIVFFSLKMKTFMWSVHISGNLYQFKEICDDKVAEGESHEIDLQLKFRKMCDTCSPLCEFLMEFSIKKREREELAMIFCRNKFDHQQTKWRCIVLLFALTILWNPSD